MSETREPSPSSAYLLRRLIREAVRPHARTIVLAVVFMAIVAISTAGLAWLMDPVVNKVFVEQDAGLLWPVGLAVLATFVIRGAATYGQSALMLKVGQRILADMQNRLFGHLLRLDLAELQRRGTGPLTAHFISDITALRQAVSTGLTGIGRDVLGVIALTAVMIWQDPMLALIACVVFPLCIAPLARAARRLRKNTTNLQEHTGKFVALLTENLTGMRLIRAFGLHAQQSARIEELTEDLRRLSVRSGLIRAISSPVMETLGGVAVSTIIIYGGWRVIEGVTTPGAFFSFITALLMAYRPMKALANLSTQMQEGLASAARIFALLDLPAIEDEAPAKTPQPPAGTLSFDDVHFAYPPRDEEPATSALNGVSFEVKPGEIVALVGPSGAGKTTVFNLLLGFCQPQSGLIKIGDTNLAHLPPSSARGAMALVAQDVALFDTTVGGNIAMGSLTASATQIASVAEAADLTNVIDGLPKGMDTPVGEAGQTLSGGQRQRIALARALLKDAPILLLDEATSALDPESEQAVATALKQRAIRPGKMTLMIAHRPSTIALADRIVVIENGRVVQDGAHDDLLSQQGTYARLFAANTSGEAG